MFQELLKLILLNWLITTIALFACAYIAHCYAEFYKKRMFSLLLFLGAICYGLFYPMAPLSLLVGGSPQTPYMWLWFTLTSLFIFFGGVGFYMGARRLGIK